eukprot:Opistho-1_new@56188
MCLWHDALRARASHARMNAHADTHTHTRTDTHTHTNAPARARAYSREKRERIKGKHGLDTHVEDLARLAKQKGLGFLLVVDQLNALEATAGLGDAAAVARKSLRMIQHASTLSVTCPRVFGYSANNENATTFAGKQRGQRDFYCFGGLSDVEFDKWWARHFQSESEGSEGGDLPESERSKGSEGGDLPESEGGEGSERGDLRDRLRTFAREDLGGVPLLLAGLLDRLGSRVRATQATLDVCLSYAKSLAISTFSAMYDWYVRNGVVSHEKRKVAMFIFEGAETGVTDFSEDYDHRYFFVGPPSSSTPVFMAVSGIALAALVEVLRAAGLHDNFLDEAFIRACIGSRNPVVKGFLVEQAVISALRLGGLVLPDKTRISGPLDIVQYRDVESVTVAPSPCVLYVPTAFNEKDVDAVLRYVSNGKVTIVALQITIGAISRHAHSVRFFTNGQDAKWVKGVAADAVQRFFVWVVRSEEARTFNKKHVPGIRRRGRSAETESQFEQFSITICDVCAGLSPI